MLSLEMSERTSSSIFAIGFCIGCWWFTLGVVALLGVIRDRRSPRSRPPLTPEKREELEATFGPAFPSWSEIRGSLRGFLAAVVVAAAFVVLYGLFWPPILVHALESRWRKR
jgi:hypothetical protein